MNCSPKVSIMVEFSEDGLDGNYRLVQLSHILMGLSDEKHR